MREELDWEKSLRKLDKKSHKSFERESSERESFERESFEKKSFVMYTFMIGRKNLLTWVVRLRR